MNVPRASFLTRPQQQQPQRNVNRQQQQGGSYDFQPRATHSMLVVQPDEVGAAAAGLTSSNSVQAAGG